MLARILRVRAPYLRLGPGHSPKNIGRFFHNVPFHDDLTPADDDYLNLGDFQHYKEAPDVKAHRRKLGLYDEGSEIQETPLISHDGNPMLNGTNASNFLDLSVAEKPVVFVSKLSDPYLNLAIEDYVYNHMPVAETGNCNRLMFYVNSPCVVVGKNQNPWREVNLPLLTNLRIPLVRRRSGGGTVVHDFGNVNFSFMTRKENFDRFTFAELVVKAVNGLESAKHKICVNERGDIITQESARKVSGSAYKLSRGKSYHHGTMLLNSKLDILRKLLHRDEAEIGHVHSPSAVASVSSPVANLHIEKQEFIDAVTREFSQTYGSVIENSAEAADPEELDQTELLGLQGFVDAFSDRACDVFTIDEKTVLPAEITSIRDELMQWEWKYGATPKFQHKFYNKHYDVHVTIDVERKGLVKSVLVEGGDSHVQASFQFLQEVLARGDTVQYTGSNVAGFVVDDSLSEWLGNAIDGTS